MKREGFGRKECDLSQKLKKFDKFGQTYKIHLDDGSDALPSKVGALCSILLFVVMIVYTGYKISILNGKKSIDIIQAVKENHFDDSHIFTAS